MSEGEPPVAELARVPSNSGSLATSATNFPTTGRLLGLDHGHVRIGVAICDPERKMASPLEIRTTKTPEKDANYFRDLIRNNGIVGAVIGLPIMLDGTEQTAAVKCRAFGTWFATATGLPVTYWDERFTSAAAEDMLLEAGLSHKQRKERRDKLAAMLLLQSFLDAGAMESKLARSTGEGVSEKLPD